MIITLEKTNVTTEADVLVEIYPRTGVMENKEEVYLYDGGNLFADFGAFLGLFLGASGMTVFDMICQLFEFIYDKSFIRSKN